MGYDGEASAALGVGKSGPTGVKTVNDSLDSPRLNDSAGALDSIDVGKPDEALAF